MVDITIQFCLHATIDFFECFVNVKLGKQVSKDINTIIQYPQLTVIDNRL